MIPNDPKLSQMVPNSPKWSQNDLSVFKLTSETISIGFLLLLRSFWVVTWLAYDNFKFRPKNSPIIASNGPKWSWNDLSILKLTSETISIGFLLLLRSFWVITWLVCNKFEFRVKNGPEWSLNGPKMTAKLPQMTSTGSKWLPKPSPSEFCSSCGRFEWSHD